jgi:hypothetical protein
MKRNILVYISIFIVTFLSFVFTGCMPIKEVTPSESTTLPSTQINNLSDFDNNIHVFKGSTNAGMIKSKPTQVDINIDFPKMPDVLYAYEVIRPNVDDEYARDLANKLGFSNEWPLYGGERTVYSYNRDNESLEIRLDGGIVFNRNDKDSASIAQLPEDQDCINIAREWLTSNNLIPIDLMKVEVKYGSSIITMDRQTGKPSLPVYLSKRVNFFNTIDGHELYVPAASVLIGKQGEVVQASIINMTISKYKMVSLKTPQAASDILKTYLARLTPVKEETPECIYYSDGDSVSINNITIKYIRTYQTDYVVPIYIFEGDTNKESNPNSEKFIGLVDAVDHQKP